MMKLLSYTIVFLLSGSIVASAANPNEPVLKEIKSHKDENGNFEAELYFDKPISKDQASIDYINDIIQVNLDDVKLAKTKIAQNIKDDKIKSLLTFKTSSNTARTQIVYKKGIDASRFIASIDADENILTIHVGYGSNIEANKDKKEAAPATTNTEAKKDISDEDLKAAAAWIEKADQQEMSNKKVAAPEISAKQETSETKPLFAKKAENSNNAKESEIAVLTNNKTQDEMHKSPSSARVILSLGLVLAMIGGFSFFAKKYFKKAPRNKNSQIKILTQHYMGPRKSLAIIQVAGESILIGVTEQNISLIKTLALLDEEIPQETPKDFSKSFKALLKNDVDSEDNAEKDEFAFSKIKDVISGKLKNMKEI